MPTMERENPAAEQSAEAQRRKQELQEQNFKKSEKLQPFLKIKVEQHKNRIASIDDKITAREAKVTASMDKIAKLTVGVDKLFVDEAHEFKNLFCPTKLANLSGVSNSASQKAFDLFMKCRYLDEKTGGRGVVLATGTPIAALHYILKTA